MVFEVEGAAPAAAPAKQEVAVLAPAAKAEQLSCRPGFRQSGRQI